MPHILDTLTEKFAKFPGIGRRQARRMVYFLMRKNKNFSSEISYLLDHLHDHLALCQESYQYFYRQSPEEARSPIARDMSRNRKQILIVEKDTDLESIEKTGIYNGTYFVLGGLTPVVDTKFNPVRESELIAEITRRATHESLEEIIFGLSINPESDHTRIVLTQKIEPLCKKYGVTISQLGRGLSTGSELEYADSDTLEHAFQKRSGII